MRPGKQAVERWLSWSKAHDWKSCLPLKGNVGSNPTLSAKNKEHPNGCSCFCIEDGGIRRAEKKTIRPDGFPARWSAVDLSRAARSASGGRRSGESHSLCSKRWRDSKGGKENHPADGFPRPGERRRPKPRRAERKRRETKRRIPLSLFKKMQGFEGRENHPADGFPARGAPST